MSIIQIVMSTLMKKIFRESNLILKLISLNSTFSIIQNLFIQPEKDVQKAENKAFLL